MQPHSLKGNQACPAVDVPCQPLRPQDTISSVPNPSKLRCQVTHKPLVTPCAFPVCNFHFCFSVSSEHLLFPQVSTEMMPISHASMEFCWCVCAHILPFYKDSKDTGLGTFCQHDVIFNYLSCHPNTQRLVPKELEAQRSLVELACGWGKGFMIGGLGAAEICWSQRRSKLLAHSGSHIFVPGSKHSCHLELASLGVRKAHSAAAGNYQSLLSGGNLGQPWELGSPASTGVCVSQTLSYGGTAGERAMLIHKLAPFIHFSSPLVTLKEMSSFHWTTGTC